MVKAVDLDEKGQVLIDLLRTMLPSGMSDILYTQGVPMTGTTAAAFTYAFNALVPKRLKSGARIWIQELGDVLENITEEEYEDLASIADCFLQITRKGAAEANLRLLARIIVGQKAYGALRADEFLYYSDIIASLRHEEIMLIGVMYKIINKEKSEGEAWIKAQGVWQNAKKELVPKVFTTEEEFVAMSGALARTGLVIPVNAVGGMIFIPSPFMNKLCSLASFENLEQEKIYRGKKA